MGAEESRIGTQIASNDLHHIWVRGRDLTEELMGQASFSEVVFLLLCERLPDPDERTLLDAVLVALMEHGLTPSAVVTRMTYGVAPESLQGAVAAGLLGAGSQVLGSMEECGEILTGLGEAVAAGGSLEDAARDVAADFRARRRKLPGLGHVIHTEGDPRARRLFEIAESCGRRGQYTRAMDALADAAARQLGRPLPINVTGAVAAVLLELGVPWRLHRGFALISRSAGLVAHVGEEIAAPITPALRRMVRE